MFEYNKFHKKKKKKIKLKGMTKKPYPNLFHVHK